MNFKDYLTSGEAAAFLGIAKQTLKIWEKKGKVVHSTVNPINGFRMYRKDELQAILDKLNGVSKARGEDELELINK